MEKRLGCGFYEYLDPHLVLPLQREDGYGVGIVVLLAGAGKRLYMRDEPR
jgi:hypothetical protein